MTAGKFTVYLVDDSEDDRLFLRKALERSPKLLVTGEACDGQDTIDFLAGAKDIPDLLLLDIKMPRKTGFDVLEWLRTQPFQEMKVAMVSGSWLAEDVAKSLSLGACAHFKKTALRAEQDAMVLSIIEILEKQSCAS